MKHINDELSNLKRLVQMLAVQFGKDSEIVLHDLSRDYEHTIIAIENNWITGRKVGDGGTNLGLEVLRNPPNTNGDIYNYFNTMADGRLLRSSTLYFRDDEGKVIGSLCINTDITRLMDFQEYIREHAIPLESREVEEVFSNKVEDLFDYFIRQSEVAAQKPPADMTKEDKIEVIRFLDGKGFFLITRSGEQVCEFLKISKYTLYKYLGIVRRKTEECGEAKTGDGAALWAKK
jgi:predicted transcriptional regulator YheO